MLPGAGSLTGQSPLGQCGGRVSVGGSVAVRCQCWKARAYLSLTLLTSWVPPPGKTGVTRSPPPPVQNSGGRPPEKAVLKDF